MVSDLIVPYWKCQLSQFINKGAGRQRGTKKTSEKNKQTKKEKKGKEWNKHNQTHIVSMKIMTKVSFEPTVDVGSQLRSWNPIQPCSTMIFSGKFWMGIEKRVYFLASD